VSFDEEPLDPHGECRDEIRRLEAKLRACAPLGSWMSAALDDPKVCDEMKVLINPFLSAIEPYMEDCTADQLSDTFARLAGRTGVIEGTIQTYRDFRGRDGLGDD